MYLKKGKAALLMAGCVGLLALLFLAAPALRSQSLREIKLGNPLEGRKVFEKKGCGHCHSVWGARGTLGPNLAKVASGKTLMQLTGLFWSHSPKMLTVMQQRGIASPSFTPEEMSGLMAYLQYLNYFDEPGSAVEGEKTFSQKGCNKCHSLGKTGGTVGPPLNKYASVMSPVTIAQAMWNHGLKMSSLMESHNVARPNIRNREMANLLAYIRSAAADMKPDRMYMAPGEPAKGKALFSAKGCIRCHSIRGSGGKVAPDLAKGPADQSVTEIASAMWNHGPQMWEKMRSMGIAVAQFSGNEMADLIAYLYSSRRADSPGDIAKGKTLFTTKGCVQCHGAAGTIGPDLSRSAALVSPMHLGAAMWNHASTMEKIVAEQGIAWPKFGGDEMRDLVQYVLSLRKSPAQGAQ